MKKKRKSYKHLTHDEKRDIAVKYYTTDATQQSLADQYGVALITIARLIHEFRSEYLHVTE